jgi:hypothetical protein
MAARLKVFSWSDGFHAFTVAASSRAKALEAWGIEGDIFKTGLAFEVKDGPDAKAALAKPGEVIERGLSVDVGKAAARPKAKPAEAKARAKLKGLEAELAALDVDQAQARDDLDIRRAALDREAAALEADQAKARKALTARITAARTKT